VPSILVLALILHTATAAATEVTTAKASHRTESSLSPMLLDNGMESVVFYSRARVCVNVYNVEAGL
jgi:hypothetical protein